MTWHCWRKKKYQKNTIGWLVTSRRMVTRSNKKTLWNFSVYFRKINKTKIQEAKPRGRKR